MMVSIMVKFISILFRLTGSIPDTDEFFYPISPTLNFSAVQNDHRN